MNGILRPKRITILHVRSKDAEQFTNLNTNFKVQLVQPIECSQTEEIHAQLISAEIPNSAYNISQNVANDTIIYDGNNSFVFPPKFYDIDELTRVINDDNTFPFSVSFDEYTGKLTFTNTDTQPHTLNWTSSNAKKVCGFGLSNDITLNQNQTASSTGVVDLATIHSVMIKSDLASGNVLSTRAGISTTLQKISIDTNTYGVIYLNQQDYRTVSVLQKPVIDSITFQLTDQNNNLLNLNDINYEFSIQFMIFDKVNPERGFNMRRGIESQSLEPQPQRLEPQPQRLEPRPRPQILTTTPQANDVQSNDVFIADADDTHPVVGKTDIEAVAEKTILDYIIDNL